MLLLLKLNNLALELRILSLALFVCTCVAVATAAVEMLGGDELMKRSRKPEIMADAAYAILTKKSSQYTGKFLIDDEVLTESGVTDLDQYAHVPGESI